MATDTGQPRYKDLVEHEPPEMLGREFGDFLVDARKAASYLEEVCDR